MRRRSTKTRLAREGQSLYDQTPHPGIEQEPLASVPTYFSRAVRFTGRNKAVLLLAVVALATRLPLLSISLDEGDSANFFNALRYGYDVTANRPHAPGYPVYVFMGWLLNTALNDPLLSLTLLSALLGSLAVIPFYFLLREMVGIKPALAGSALFIANPLVWSFSEVALSDAPSMFFVVLGAWLSYVGMRSDRGFLFYCLAISLAIGVRQPNISVAVLLVFPVGYRILVSRERPWRLMAMGAGLFALTSAAWFFPSVFLGSNGFDGYFESLYRQWSLGVRVTDVTHLEPPLAVNLIYRIERFYLGYFVTHAWTGTDDKTALSLLLATPWVFGFVWFVADFRLRSPAHVFVALWLVSLAYPIVAIHFLPRYGLPQLPGFIIACVVGYRYVATRLPDHPLRFEVMSVLGIGTVLLMYGVKYQPPLGSFESSPPVTPPYAVAFVLAGVSALAVGRWLAMRHSGRAAGQSSSGKSALEGGAWPLRTGALVAILAILAAPYAMRGYNLASLAHRTPSPSQQLAKYVIENFDRRSITPCWGLQTQFIYGALRNPSGGPVGFGSLEALLSSHEQGRTLLISDKCRWYQALQESLELHQIARFTGASPVWSKAPSIGLYAASGAR